MITTITTLCGLTVGVDRDLGLVFPLTPCCKASGKGAAASMTGVCCRACYREVPALYGAAITLGQPGEPVQMEHWISTLTDCPVPEQCAEHTLWAITREPVDPDATPAPPMTEAQWEAHTERTNR